MNVSDFKENLSFFSVRVYTHCGHFNSKGKVVNAYNGDFQIGMLIFMYHGELQQKYIHCYVAMMCAELTALFAVCRIPSSYCNLQCGSQASQFCRCPVHPRGLKRSDALTMDAALIMSLNISLLYKIRVQKELHRIGLYNFLIERKHFEQSRSLSLVLHTMFQHHHTAM